VKGPDKDAKIADIQSFANLGALSLSDKDVGLVDQKMLIE
jgi:hypothetical protein